MEKTMRRRIGQEGKNRGFTLIELVMVIVLLGIMAATAVMMIGSIITQQRTDETLKEIQNLANAMVGNPDLIEGGI
ncbi:MAG: prepilin-type N-terminal cleavage/methylation domain-containing protein, partial [Deltaproteobacteria bacterium]